MEQPSVDKAKDVKDPKGLKPPPKKDVSKGSVQVSADPTPPPHDAEEEEEEQEESQEPPFLPNDYIEKAEMEPPQDPDGTECIHANLIVSHERIVQILTDGLLTTLTWLMSQK